MTISSTSMPAPRVFADAADAWAANVAAAPQPPSKSDSLHNGELREAFDDFVGQTFYGHLLRAMRQTVGKPAYLHGGRAEEVFQAQLDQLLVEAVSDASADKFSGPMFDLFTLPRTS